MSCQEPRLTFHYTENTEALFTKWMGILPQVSKQRDSGLDISNRFKIWQGCRDGCQISDDMIVITSHLAASRRREIWRFGSNTSYHLVNTNPDL